MILIFFIFGIDQKSSKEKIQIEKLADMVIAINLFYVDRGVRFYLAKK